jgi:pSer/pThr/pTyr-binding forkhead associated (FHA) protein
VSSEGLAQAFDAPPSQTMEVRHLDEVDELDERDASDERDGHEAGTPMVVVVRDGQVVLEYPFTVDEIVIGRNRLANIPLDDRALSRDHAKLARRGASFWVSDLGSANGTYVGAERITEPRLLRSGDVVVIGHYQLRIDGVEEAPTDTPVLTISGPDGTHRFGMVGADIVVGRADDCDVAINNRSISRRHLQISRGAQRGSFVATNISGHNVVKVDGMPIDEPTPFSLGSQIEIGDFTITVGYLDGNGEQKDSTMVIDRTALAKAAYIDGDYGDASAGSHATSRR